MFLCFLLFITGFEISGLMLWVWSVGEHSGAAPLAHYVVSRRPSHVVSIANGWFLPGDRKLCLRGITETSNELRTKVQAGQENPNIITKDLYPD